jgi:hypothetical protein
MTKILYNDRPEIGLPELSSIYLALISSADQIYINKDINIRSTLGKDVISHIDDNLSYLEDIGLVKKWSWPYTTPSQKKHDLVVFPEEDYFYWSTIINETFLRSKNLVSILNEANEIYGTSAYYQEERTSKLIEIKKEYMTFATCCTLKLDQILNNFGKQDAPWTKTEYSRYINVKKPLIKKVFSAYGIPDLWVLKGEDVESFHNKSFAFRSMVNLATIDNENRTEKAFEYISSELFKFLDERISEASKSIAASILMNVYGLFFPPASFAPNLNDAITEISNRQKYGFLYFLSGVKKISNKRIIQRKRK